MESYVALLILPLKSYAFRRSDSPATFEGFSCDFCGTVFRCQSGILILRSREEKGGIFIPEIIISVRDKLPVVTGTLKHIVSDNTDYTVRFDFDGEWDGLRPKTVFFADGASGENYPVVMDGNTCVMPLISDWHTLLIGVQAGELHTTRPAALPVFPSIARRTGSAVQPEEFDKWEQIMARLLSPVDKTDEMTVPIGRDADGKLWVTQGNIRIEYNAETGSLTIGGTANA